MIKLLTFSWYGFSIVAVTIIRYHCCAPFIPDAEKFLPEICQCVLKLSHMALNHDLKHKHQTPLPFTCEWRNSFPLDFALLSCHLNRTHNSSRQTSAKLPLANLTLLSSCLHYRDNMQNLYISNPVMVNFWTNEYHSFFFQTWALQEYSNFLTVYLFYFVIFFVIFL